RLERRIGDIFYDKWSVKQIGRHTLAIMFDMYTSESQGANRVNFAAEGTRHVINNLFSLFVNARGGILTNWHSKRGATGELTVPLFDLSPHKELIKDMLILSERSKDDEDLARKLNQTMLEFATYADLVTGQDTRANLVAAIFQAYEEEPVQGIHGKPTYDPSKPSYKPLMLLEIKGAQLVIKLNGPWASARTAVGRTVNKFGMVKISRDKMDVPIEGDPTGKVQQLDRKTAMGVLFAGFEFFLSESMK
ncbi:hypothetical protein DID80_08170, partial [Candidatus Marinamargulisbacteria bacterium SCGC AAA071-K20]